MSKQLNALDYLGNVDKFSTLFIRVNELVAALNVETITVNSLANGALTSGNGFVNGIFGANTLVVYNTLRGGNVQASANLTIGSNVSFMGNKLDLTPTAVINIGSHYSNATHHIVPTQVSVGNSTVNLVLTSNSITIGGTSYSNLSPKIAVANNFVMIGTRGKLNFKPSNSVQVLLEDDAANDCINVTVSNTLEPSAAGDDTYVQFNDIGVFGAANTFTFAKVTSTLSVANNVIAKKYELVDGGRVTSFACTISTTSSIIIDSFPKADFRTIDYIISVKNNIANAYQATKLLVIHDGGAVSFTEYGTINTNTSIVSFEVSSNTTHVLINCTSTSTNTSIKGIRNMVAV